MQQVAREMHLSETAFTWPDGERFQLRWFTPGSEVPLCGHATLAAAHVLWETGRARGRLRFETLSGTLAARRDGEDVQIDLPGQPVRPAELPAEIQESFATARFVGRTPDRGLDDVDYLIELDTAAAVLDLSPPLEALRRLPGGFIVTAEGDTEGQDYICRYFAPWFGIDEDPVTGAAHCALGNLQRAWLTHSVLHLLEKEFLR